MILPININDFWSAKSEYFLQILQYETSESSSNNENSASHLDWTVFFLKLCDLFPKSFAFVNFLVMFIVARTFPSLFFIIKYLSIVTTATQFVLYVHECYPYFFTKSRGQARKRHIRNINKNLLHGPGYH